MKSSILKCLLLIITTALLTAFITCYFCKRKDLDPIPDKDRSNSICMDYVNEPPAVLTSEMVKSMVTNYGNTQLNNIQTAPTNAVIRDAKSIWFDLETIKKFIYQIEHNAATNFAQSQNKKFGIRIYYASYPKNSVMEQIGQGVPNFAYNPNYEFKHTLVMIPTIADISDANHVNYDFNPLDVNSYIGFTNMKKNGDASFEAANYAILSFGPGCDPEVNASGESNPSMISARNHGALFPPDAVNGMIFN